LKDVVICGLRVAIKVDVTCSRVATIGVCAFGYAGLKAWNSLPDYLRCSDLSYETFKTAVKDVSVCTLHRVSKNKQNNFCHNFVKFPQIVIVFGTMMANSLKLYEVH